MPKDADARAPWGRLAALLATMILTLVVARGETTLPPPPLPRRFQVSAWVPYWDRDRVRASFAAHIADLDQVSFFWYEVQPDGSVSAFPGAEDATLLALARDHDLRVLATVTNNLDGPRVAALLADDETREAHVRAIVSLMQRMAYDGVDLDYEALPAEARDDLTAFIESLAQVLHAQDKLLSVAVHAKTDDQGTWDGPRAQDWARLGAAVDEFKVMAYDYHWGTSPPGPMAPLHWIDDVLAYARQTVPSSKIWLGLPFYGRDWSEQQGKGLVWASAERLIQQHQPTTHRDPSSGEIHFSYTASDIQHTVYIPDAEAVAAKIRLARQQHPDIAGLAIWRLGGESLEHWTAIRHER